MLYNARGRGSASGMRRKSSNSNISVRVVIKWLVLGFIASYVLFIAYAFKRTPWSTPVPSPAEQQQQRQQHHSDDISGTNGGGGGLRPRSKVQEEVGKSDPWPVHAVDGNGELVRADHGVDHGAAANANANAANGGEVEDDDDDEDDEDEHHEVIHRGNIARDNAAAVAKTAAEAAALEKENRKDSTAAADAENDHHEDVDVDGGDGQDHNDDDDDDENDDGNTDNNSDGDDDDDDNEHVDANSSSNEDDDDDDAHGNNVNADATDKNDDDDDDDDEDKESITHKWQRAVHGHFYTLGAYGVDGEHTTDPSTLTDDLIVIIVGAGHVMENAIITQLGELPAPERVVPELECEFTAQGNHHASKKNVLDDEDDHAGQSAVVWRTPALVHTRGTEYSGKKRRTGEWQGIGEITMWISCKVDPIEAKAAGAIITRTDGTFAGSVSLHHHTNSNNNNPDSDDQNQVALFETPKLDISWHLSKRYESIGAVYNAVLCSAPVYGLNGAQWLIEWVEYQRAFGFDHIHLYLFQPNDVLLGGRRIIKKQGIVTLHMWPVSVGGPSGHSNWEHGQRLARNDCFLRNRGKAAYLAFTDIDELISVPYVLDTLEDTDENENENNISKKKKKKKTLAPFDPREQLVEYPTIKTITTYCENAYKSKPRLVAFQLSSITVPPFPAALQPITDNWTPLPPTLLTGDRNKDKGLLLSRIQVAEKECTRPYNCGPYHKGRQKYILRTSFAALNPNSALFYHGISRDYGFSNAHSLQVPANVGVLRHYAGHFPHIKNGGLAFDNRVPNVLPPSLLAMMAAQVVKSVFVLDQYQAHPETMFLKLGEFGDVWRFAGTNIGDVRENAAAERQHEDGVERKAVVGAGMQLIEEGKDGDDEEEEEEEVQVHNNDDSDSDAGVSVAVNEDAAAAAAADDDDDDTTDIANDNSNDINKNINDDNEPNKSNDDDDDDDNNASADDYTNNNNNNNNNNNIKKGQDPVAPATLGFITYDRFGGRLNNQLLTYDWTFRLALAFSRTLFIHSPIGHHSMEHWIGFPGNKQEDDAGTSLWDVPLLRQGFNFKFEWEVNEEFGSVAQHPVLSLDPSELHSNCVWRYGSGRQKYINLWLAKVNQLPECKDRVHFMTQTGLVHPYKSDTSKYGVGPLAFWTHFNPQSFIRNQVQEFIRTKAGDGREKLVGIHTRAHNSYGEPLAKSTKRCGRIALKLKEDALRHVHVVAQCCTPTQIRQRAALISPGLAELNSRGVSELWENKLLEDMCHVQQPIVALALAAGNAGKGGVRLVHATDHEQKDVDELIASQGGINYVYDMDTFDRGNVMLPETHKVQKLWLNIEGVLMDMTLMRNADAFFGSPSSTVSQVICFWRLADSLKHGTPEESNMCSLVLLASQTDVCEAIECEAGGQEAQAQPAHQAEKEEKKNEEAASTQHRKKQVTETLRDDGDGDDDADAEGASEDDLNDDNNNNNNKESGSLSVEHIDTTVNHEEGSATVGQQQQDDNEQPELTLTPEQVQQGLAVLDYDLLRSSTEKRQMKRPRALMVVQPFLGRFNNMLITFDWAFRIAKAFGRTLFVRSSEWMAYSASWPRSRHSETTPGRSIWNLTALRDHFDVIFEWEMNEAFGSFHNHPVLRGYGLPHVLPSACVWTRANGGKYLPQWMAVAVQEPVCADLVYFESGGGLIHQYKSVTTPYGVSVFAFWHALRPAKFVIDAAEQFRQDVSKHDKVKVVGIHTRAHRTHVLAGTEDITCKRLSAKMKGSANVIARRMWQCCAKNGKPQMDGLVYPAQVSALWNARLLDDMCEVNQKMIDFVHKYIGADSALVHASDKEQSHVDELLASAGARSFVLEEDEKEHMKEMHVFVPHVEVLIDMWVLRSSDFFMGSPSSTVSQVICSMRLGEEHMTGKAELSNMCDLFKLNLKPRECDALIPGRCVPHREGGPAAKRVHKDSTGAYDEISKPFFPDVLANPLQRLVTELVQASNDDVVGV